MSNVFVFKTYFRKVFCKIDFENCNKNSWWFLILLMLMLLHSALGFVDVEFWWRWLTVVRWVPVVGATRVATRVLDRVSGSRTGFSRLQTSVGSWRRHFRPMGRSLKTQRRPSKNVYRSSSVSSRASMLYTHTHTKSICTCIWMSICFFDWLIKGILGDWIWRASDKCQREKRKTINGDDLLWAMATLGFEDYIDPLKVYLARYREVVSFFTHCLEILFVKCLTILFLVLFWPEQMLQMEVWHGLLLSYFVDLNFTSHKHNVYAYVAKFIVFIHWILLGWHQGDS